MCSLENVTTIKETGQSYVRTGQSYMQLGERNNNNNQRNRTKLRPNKTKLRPSLHAAPPSIPHEELHLPDQHGQDADDGHQHGPHEEVKDRPPPEAHLQVRDRHLPHSGPEAPTPIHDPRHGGQSLAVARKRVLATKVRGDGGGDEVGHASDQEPRAAQHDGVDHHLPAGADGAVDVEHGDAEDQHRHHHYGTLPEPVRDESGHRASNDASHVVPRGQLVGRGLPPPVGLRQVEGQPEEEGVVDQLEKSVGQGVRDHAGQKDSRQKTHRFQLRGVAFLWIRQFSLYVVRVRFSPYALEARFSLYVFEVRFEIRYSLYVLEVRFLNFWKLGNVYDGCCFSWSMKAAWTFLSVITVRVV